MRKAVSLKISFITIIILSLLVMVLLITIHPSKVYGDSYDIGDTGPAGGIIFYIDGSYYLEVAPSDQGNVVWSDVVALLDTTGTAIGTGKANTAAIIAQGATSGAAVVCDNYELNGYDDWFLPSKDELYEMYINQAVISGLVSWYYWSSSEYNLESAWDTHLVNGNSTVLFKSDPDYVRPIRAFKLGDPTSKKKEPVWVRTMSMTCWQVWINEDNNFQFIFWYPYADKNWIRIYDMEENLAYEGEILHYDPNLIVDLPDGYYWVKTYHDQELLQEFLIGKPGPEM